MTQGSEFRTGTRRSRWFLPALAGAGALVFLAAALLTMPSVGGGMMGMGGMMGGMFASVAAFVFFLVLLALAVIGWLRPAPAVKEPPGEPAAPVSTPSAATAPPAVPEAPAVREKEVFLSLTEDERLLYLRIRDGGGTVLQSDLVRWGRFSKAKVTRLLDRLERRGLAVRERHGMTNRVRLLAPRGPGA